jgi:hypothetical protein
MRQNYRKRITVGCEERRQFSGVFVHAERDHLEITALLAQLIELLDLRQFLTARNAPGGP